MSANYKFTIDKGMILVFGLTAILLLSGCRTHKPSEDAEFLSALQAHEDAELSIDRAFEKLADARANVIAVIESIPDPKKREVTSALFDRNEKAWSELIESEALIQQGVISLTNKATVRYVRIADAERASTRVAQLNDLAATIRARFH